MTAVTPHEDSCANPKVLGGFFENVYSDRQTSTRIESVVIESVVDRHEATGGGNDLVTRALKSNTLWLTVTYVGLIFLMARAYT